ncbi:MAG: hypothetical protein NWP83_04180, partial [Spirosomaceae bacterium]|nr:hypothetical protein [Spirosomataceae bacterium]
MRTILLTHIFSLFSLFEEPVKGLDERINDAFTPISEAWQAIVLYPIFGIPFVVLLLVCGAGFFTIYFSFINIRRFPLALRVVAGKYDEIEQGGAPVTTPNLNVVDGDIVGTIRIEGEA